MKKIIIILLVFFLSLNLAYSQSGWIVQSSGTYENLNGIFFPYNIIDNSTSGLAVGNAGVVLKTTNSGVNWSSISFPAGSNNLCVTFKNPQLGFVGNQNGKIYSTTNFGSNWTEINTGATYEVNSMMFTPSGNYGWLGNYYGNVMRTTNNGTNWTTMTTMNGYYAKVFCLDDYRVWAVDNYGYVFRSTNSGTNFSSARPVTSALRGVCFVTSTIGYAVGDSGKILKSTNGGSSFTLLNSGVTHRLNSIAAIDPFNIWVAGYNGVMLKSTNGGNNWTSYSYTSNNLSQIFFISGTSYGYCAGNFGTVLRTLEAPGSGGIGSGSNLIPIPFNTAYTDGRTNLLYYSSELSSLIGFSSARITSIGFNIGIVNSQPINGLNVRMQSTTLSSLTGYASSGWITVFSGNITLPGTGIHYLNLQTPYIWSSPMNLLMEICFDNSAGTSNTQVLSTLTSNNTVIHNATNLSGQSGCINITGGNVLKTRPNLFIRWFPIPTGLGGITNEVPKEFKLFQNYPNPFNPTTNIGFNIPRNGFVTLKIYDILGKEVETLVKENMNAGEYIISFSGNNLPSGLYFYRLTANGFSDTKKMILIK